MNSVHSHPAEPNLIAAELQKGNRRGDSDNGFRYQEAMCTVLNARTCNAKVHKALSSLGYIGTVPSHIQHLLSYARQFANSYQLGIPG